MSIYEELKKPLDKAALKKHPSKSFLTVINPMYVVERLNDVFGVGAWSASYEVIESGEHPVVKCILIVDDHGIYVEQFGGNQNVDRGDSFKGAATDALTKCASYIGVGMDIYKGLSDDGSEGLAWLSDSQCYAYVKRIENGEAGLIQKLKDNFKISKANQKKLDEAEQKRIEKLHLAN